MPLQENSQQHKRVHKFCSRKPYIFPSMPYLRTISKHSITNNTTQITQRQIHTKQTIESAQTLATIKVFYKFININGKKKKKKNCTGSECDYVNVQGRRVIGRVDIYIN